MFLRCLLLFVLIFQIQACNYTKEVDDLTSAKEAIENQEWLYAERLLERYLNTEEDSQKRWEAWQNLVLAADKTDAHASVLRLYYENMLQEFLYDEDKKKFILYGLGLLLEQIKDFDTAIDTWNMYLALNNLSTNETYAVTRQIIEIYLQTGQFESAENALYNCLGLEVSSKESSLCLYELADIKAERGVWQEATDLAMQVLEVDALPYVHGQASFLLGDIAEQQGKYEEALAFFEQSKELYPNTLAVENRINYLQDLFKK